MRPARLIALHTRLSFERRNVFLSLFHWNDRIQEWLVSRGKENKKKKGRRKEKRIKSADAWEPPNPNSES